MNLFSDNNINNESSNSSPLPSEDHIKRMFYYCFILVLVLIGLRLIHFQILILFSDLFTGVIIWVTVCTMNKYVALFSLANACLGLVYAIIETFQRLANLGKADNVIGMLMLIILVICALLTYSLDIYCSYYGFKVFDVYVQNNMNNEGSPPTYNTVQNDMETAKENIVYR